MEKPLPGDENKTQKMLLLGWYRTHAHTHTHVRTHARTHTHTHARTHARMHARTHARTHTHTHTQTHADSHQCRFLLFGSFEDKEGGNVGEYIYHISREHPGARKLALADPSKPQKQLQQRTNLALFMRLAHPRSSQA